MMKYTLFALSIAFASTVFAQDIGDVGPGDSKAARNAIEKVKLEAMRKRAMASVEELIKTLGPKEKKMVMDAREAEPFPKKLIVGRWYNKTDDADGLSVATHNKEPNGANEWKSVDLFHAEKEYEASEGKGIWIMEGRILIEADTGELDFPVLYIIKDLKKDKFKYVIVFEDAPHTDWEESVDIRTRIEFPKCPKGYDDVTGKAVAEEVAPGNVN